MFTFASFSKFVEVNLLMIYQLENIAFESYYQAFIPCSLLTVNDPVTNFFQHGSVEFFELITLLKHYYLCLRVEYFCFDLWEPEIEMHAQLLFLFNWN